MVQKIVKEIEEMNTSKEEDFEDFEEEGAAIPKDKKKVLYFI